MNSPLDVLKYWFGLDYGEHSPMEDRLVIQDVAFIKSRMPIWFARADPSFDILQMNSAALLECDLDSSWGDDSFASLAKIIVFDQFSRSIYRGTPKAFEYDTKATNIVEDLASKDVILSQFTPLERLFIILPLQHAENCRLQELGMHFASQISTGASPEVRNYFDNLPGFHNEHYDVVMKFGRFPSRNAALERESTSEELIWLASPDIPAWAKSQVKK